MMTEVGEGRGAPKKHTRVLISCVSVTVTSGGGGQRVRKFCGHHVYLPP